MATGLRVINDFGTVLIDTVSPALALRKKSTLVSSNLTVPIFTVENADSPVVVVYSPTFIRAPYIDWVSSTKRYHTGLVYGSFGSVNIDFFAFDKLVASGNTYGLKLYDAAGNLTFDSSLKHARVVADLTANGTFNGTSGRKYAGVIVGSYYKDEIIDPGIPGQRQRDVYATHIRSTGSQLIVGSELISSITYPSGDSPTVIAERGAPRVLVVDV